LLHKANGLPVMIVGGHGRVMWSEVFDNNPYIVRRPPPTRHCNRLVSGGGVRPYIEMKTAARWYWRQYKPVPAELFFTPAEKTFAEPYRGKVLVEPEVKNNGHSNKAWPFNRWVELTQILDLPWLQCASPGSTRSLPSNVAQVHTPNFRLACAVLSVCKAFVGTDGGLMHAAAAVNVPAVILWSEFTSPAICGYKSMTNLRHAGSPCGNRTDCKSCRLAMSRITVDEVVNAMKGIL
jgi:ADP-heptose:LPS heptosyltransferase